jgi:hypothetical protein
MKIFFLDPGCRIFLVQLESGVFQCLGWLRIRKNKAGRKHPVNCKASRKGTDAQEEISTLLFYEIPKHFLFQKVQIKHGLH